MRIASQDRSSFIDLRRRDESGFVLVDVEASIGQFTARSRGNSIADPQSFLHALAAFEARRSGAVALQDDEQCFELRIKAYDRLGHLWVGVTVAWRSFSPIPENVEPLQFSGGFIYDADYATQLFADLRDLLAPAA